MPEKEIDPFWQNPENIEGFRKFREELPESLSPRLERRTRNFYRFQKGVVDYYSEGLQPDEEGQIDYLIDQKISRRRERLMKDILTETGQNRRITPELIRQEDEVKTYRAVSGFVDALREQLALSTKLAPALIELRDLITDKYPNAQFRVTFGLDEPFGVHLRPTLDIEDPTEISSTFMDKLLDFQIEQRLPIYVFPEKTH